MGTKQTNDKFDVAVVGAGPTGAIAAMTAAQSGAKTLLIEEHEEIGTPVRCAGLISKKGFKALSASENTIIREISGALIHAPNGNYLSIGGEETKAYVVDRKKLDLDLARRATRAGVILKTGVRAVRRDHKQLELSRNDLKYKVQATVVIGADGPFSQVAKWANLATPRKLIYGIQAVVASDPKRSEFVEGYLGNEIAPNFFAWVIPYRPGLVLAGLGTDSTHKDKLKNFLDKLLDVRFSMRINQVNELTSGVIPIGPAKVTTKDRSMIVGDAAGQAKPTSGGGIYTGSACARIAGKVAAKCTLNGDLSANSLKKYDDEWKSILGRELNFGFKAHQILNRLSDEDLNKIVEIINEPEIIELINEYGDMDYSSRLILKLLKVSKVWQGFFSLVPKRVADLISSY